MLILSYYHNMIIIIFYYQHNKMTNSIVPLQLHLGSGPFIHSGGGSVVMKLPDIEFYGLDEERGRALISFVSDIRCKRVRHSSQVFCRLSSASPRLRL